MDQALLVGRKGIHDVLEVAVPALVPLLLRPMPSSPSAPNLL